MAILKFKDEGINAKKVLVLTKNADCIGEVCRIAGDGIAEHISSKSPINGGVLVHLSTFADETAVAKVLAKIKETVERIDNLAEINALNFAVPNPPP